MQIVNTYVNVLFCQILVIFRINHLASDVDKLFFVWLVVGKVGPGRVRAGEGDGRLVR